MHLCWVRPYISHILWRGRLKVRRCYMHMLVLHSMLGGPSAIKSG